VSARQPTIDRLSTGSSAFDRILGGGLPARSQVMVAGESGAGKSIFALQMLFHLARQGNKGLYLTTLSEPSLKLISYMQQFSFFEERLLQENRVVIRDLGSVARLESGNETLTKINSIVEAEEPALLVIDSFKALRELLGESSSVRTFAYDLSVHAATWGATTLLVGEYSPPEIVSYAEFAISDGILRFSTRRQELTAVREVEVLKLRGANCISGAHFFEIGASGLTFSQRVVSPEIPAAESAKLDERLPSGIAGLDTMLGGGFPRASSTVVQGATGTGKTLLGLQFLLEGARRGEPGIHFTFEETADQLRQVVKGLGFDLRQFEERGLISLTYTSPVELSTDRFLDRARQEVERVGARRVVLDSLTSMALGIVSERRFKELVYAMTKHFRAAGVTLNMNMEVAELLGSAQLSGQGISFAADNLIQLKYVEIEGRLERGIAVLKARGVRHATDARRLSVGANGVSVGPPFTGLRGVLTGLPTQIERSDHEARPDAP
jgi:circadian clock protein KaiC